MTSLIIHLKSKLNTVWRIPCRTYLRINPNASKKYKSFFTEKTESRLKISDRVTSSYELIYRDGKEYFVRFGYRAITLMLFVTFGSSIHYMWDEYKKQNTEAKTDWLIKKLTPLSSIHIVGGLTVTSLFTVFVMLYVHRYPVRIYRTQGGDKYKAIFIGKLPFTVEHHHFEAKEIQKLPKWSLNPFTTNSFLAGKRKILLFEDKFRTYDDYYRMSNYKIFELD